MSNVHHVPSLTPNAETALDISADSRGPHRLSARVSDTRRQTLGNRSRPRSQRTTRYYSHALSEEEKIALARGEQGNVHPWSIQDAMSYHEARRRLVPTTMDNPTTDDTYVHITEKAKRRHHRFFQKKHGSAQRHSFSPANDRNMYHANMAHHASQSMHNFPSARDPSIHSAPVTPFRPQFPIEELPAGMSHSTRARAASTDDYFSRHPHHDDPPIEVIPLLPSITSSRASRASSYIRSSLSSEVPRHVPNPATTFDDFLVPHKSGKGEAYKGAANAKKVEPPADAVHSRWSAQNGAVHKKSPAKRTWRRIPAVKKALKKRVTFRDDQPGPR